MSKTFFLSGAKYVLSVAGPVVVEWVKNGGLPTSPKDLLGLAGMILIALAGLHMTPPGTSPGASPNA